MNINIEICLTVQRLRHCIGQAFHSGSFRVSRENTVQVLIIFPADTATSFFKLSSTDCFHNDHPAIDLLRFQILSQFYSCLNSHMFSCVDCCSDQNCFARILSADHGIRKCKLSTAKFEKSVLFGTWCSTERIQLLYSFLFFICVSIPDILSLSYCTDHKHRSRMIVQFLLLAPHTLPDFCVHRHRRKTIFL